MFCARVMGQGHQTRIAVQDSDPAQVRNSVGGMSSDRKDVRSHPQVRSVVFSLRLLTRRTNIQNIYSHGHFVGFRCVPDISKTTYIKHQYDNDNDHSFSQLSVHKAPTCCEGLSAWALGPSLCNEKLVPRYYCSDLVALGMRWVPCSEKEFALTKECVAGALIAVCRLMVAVALFLLDQLSILFF